MTLTQRRRQALLAPWAPGPGRRSPLSRLRTVSSSQQQSADIQSGDRRRHGPQQCNVQPPVTLRRRRWTAWTAAPSRRYGLEPTL